MKPRMHRRRVAFGDSPSMVRALVLSALAALALLVATQALAVPAFNRQTGQNCLACHVGGQFPELTAYGRLFKLTGYTLGSRAVPLSLMGVWGLTRTAHTAGEDSSNFPKNGAGTFQGASVFAAAR